MDDVPLYNSRILNTYIEYLKKYYPTVDVGSILKDAEIGMHQLEDGGYWFTQRQCDRFQEVLAEKTGNFNLPREAGRYTATSKAGGLMQQYVLGFVTPRAAYMLLEKIYPQLSRASILKTKMIKPTEIEVQAIPKTGVNEKPYQCENRIGTFEAIAKLFTGKVANIRHPVCLHKGAELCKYILTWEDSRANRWKRYRNYGFLTGFILGAAFLIYLKPPHWDLIILLYLTVLIIVYSYFNHLEKAELIKNIASQGDSAERLLNQMNQRYNESMLIREIGQATSMILDTEKLMKFIMESLEKRMDFDRGMIMLTNREKTHLTYNAGFGYHLNDLKGGEKISFRLDKPESKGIVVQTFRQQKPYLVNDVKEFEYNFSQRSREVAKKMEVNSFICVPIVFEQIAMGVLMVDNVNSKRPLTESDMSLLMGIAPQIAISITNASSFEKIRTSEEKFKALSENAPDIIYTIDKDGLINYVNPSWERILGYTTNEVLGTSVNQFLKKDDMRIVNDTIIKIINRKNPTVDMYASLIHKSGEERLFSMSGAPNFDESGNVVGVVGTLKDITDLKRSEAELQNSYHKLKLAMDSTIEAISLIVESRDPYTAGHQKRVAALAGAIAGAMNMPEDQVEKIHMGSLIHDIGKIHVPAEILTKPGRLSKIEYEMMKAHPEIGYKILKTVDFIPPIAQMVYQHHERIDGSGYPLGISGKDMLLESKIIAVADSVEAMASHRPYRPAIGVDKALEMISENKGKLFDSQVVDACLSLFMEKGFKFPIDDHSPTLYSGE